MFSLDGQMFCRYIDDDGVDRHPLVRHKRYAYNASMEQGFTAYMKTVTTLHFTVYCDIPFCSC